jgi:hypothetical protein
MQTITVEYDPKERLRWKLESGELQKEWAQKYPLLFDSDDLRIALSQSRMGRASRSYHFAEWLTAIYWYNRGWRVLVEQYGYRPHPRKRQVLESLIGTKKMSTIPHIGTQAPDLLVYKPKTGEFFFCEAKMDNDIIRPQQKQLFREIAKELDTKVIVANVVSK